MEDFYSDETDSKERQIIGYCSYDKSPILEGDDVVRYKGGLYHRENFIQASIGVHGSFIDPCEVEE